MSADPGDPDITGAIHIDYDRDGTIDAGEEALTDRPPGGVTLTAYDSAGGSAPCSISASDASYSCDVTMIGAGPFRLELALADADVAAGWSDTLWGPDYGAFTQRVAAGGAVNFGIVPPTQCSLATDGELFTNCYINGDRTIPGPKDDTFVVVPFDNSAGPTVLADKATTGALWGVAYDPWDDVIYSSAFLKRHVDLGPEGIDGLYYTVDDGATWQSYNLGAAFGADLTRDIEGKGPADASYDVEAFGLVGKHGVGDINVTPDGNSLLAANLATNSVHVYDVSGVAAGGEPIPGAVVQVASPCPGDYQIFALHTVDAVSTLVGVTCTGPATADLAAKVVQLNLADGSQSTILDVPLGNYDRPCAGSDTATIGRDTCLATTANGEVIVDSSWLPWSDDINDYGFVAGNPPIANTVQDVIRPQPLFSDIEVTDDGGLVLGLIDRTMHQIGNRNCVPDETAACDGAASDTLVKTIQAGEILRVCNTGTLAAPVYAIEGSAGCATNFVTGPNPAGGDPAQPTNNGLYTSNPTGSEGEFFQDGFNPTELGGNPVDPAVDGTPHGEISSGGLYYQEYSNLVVQTAMDTETNFGTGGLNWLSTIDGADVDGRDLYVFADDGVAGGTFAKAGGIGDVEGCGLFIEIGDFVWLDLNGDGIQDPSEPAIGGVTVTLSGGPDNLVLAEKTTDADGYYVFGPADGVEPNSDYTLTFDVLGANKTITGLPDGVTPADLEETIANAGDDQRDSDLENGVITVSTDVASNHTLDAAYTVPVYDLALILELKQDQASEVDVGDDISLSVTVENQGTLSSDDFDITVYLPAGTVLNDADWTDNGDGTATYTAAPDKLEPGETGKYEILLTATEPGPKELAWAEISADSGDDVDSTPDAINGEEGESPLSTDNSLTDPEDDHDPESITITEIYDLALILELKDGQPESVDVGDEVSLSITVENQGNVSSDDFDITVYIPSGTVLNDPAWTDNGDGTATYTAPTDKLEPGQTGKYTILLEASEPGPKELAWAEISADSGDDVDSTPDAINGEENESPLATDNSLTEPEDDHDPESITVAERYDLALILELDPEQPAEVGIGDPINLSVTVENQGNVSSDDFDIIVYVPEGSVLDDPDWTDNGDGTATYTAPTEKLEPGEQGKYEITLEATERNPKHFAWAEISNDSGDDVDSTPDAINGEEAESPLPTDNSLSEIEDDHDPESLTIVGIFDLALRKTVDIEATGTIAPGSDVVFNVEIFNQGQEPSVNPVVIDYVDVTNFMPFEAADNPAGTADGLDYSWAALANGNGEVSLTGTLAPGASVTIPVTLTIADSPADLLGMDNYAEITDGGSPLPDVDSTPDSDNGNDENIDDAIDDPNDEDDHDGALVPVLDLALRERYPVDGDRDLNFRSVERGEDVTFEIQIFNQGNVAAKDIEIVDFIPAGLILNDPDWTEKEDGTAEIIVPGVLLPGADTVVEITFTVAETLAIDAELENKAEISDFVATDDQGTASFPAIGDIDSTPDKLVENDQLIDDRIDDDGTEDQDDHDVLGLIVIDTTIVVPPTATPVPPTATPVPPTATPVPPTVTPIPPTPIPPVIIVVTPTPVPKKIVPTPTPEPKKATPLAVTGSDSAPLVLLASSMLVLGGTSLLVSRRRKDA